MLPNFAIICGSETYNVSFEKMAMYCALFQNVQKDSKFPGCRYRTQHVASNAEFTAFLRYIDLLVKENDDRKSVFVNDNYDALNGLAEEFQCDTLTQDLREFHASRMVTVSGLLDAKGRLDDASWTEEALADDPNGLIALLMERGAATLEAAPPPDLCRIFERSLANGVPLNSQLICQFLLQPTTSASYAPLVKYMSIEKLPLDMALDLLRDKRYQEWMDSHLDLALLTEIKERLDQLQEFITSMHDDVDEALQGSRRTVSTVQATSTDIASRVSKLEQENARLLASRMAYYTERPKRVLIRRMRAKQTPFKKLVVLKQSSQDLYGWLHPESGGREAYVSENAPGAWISIQFRTAVRVSKLTISTAAFGPFPKSLQVMFSDGPGKPPKLVIPVTQEQRLFRIRLDGPNKKKTIEFDPILISFVKICAVETPDGSDWSGTNYLILGGFELYGPKGRDYSTGVFSQLFRVFGEEVRNAFEVRARDNDGSDIHNPLTRQEICTGKGPGQWLEVSFAQQRVCVSAYRMAKSLTSIRAWSLMGSNDRNLPLDKWKILHQYYEETEEEKTEAVQEFSVEFSTPFKFIRIVNDGEDWAGQEQLSLRHFDIDGALVPEFLFQPSD